MGLAGLRAPWIIAALVAILALPIFGITAYLTLGVQQQIARAQGERAGIEQIRALQAAFAATSALATATACSNPRTSGGTPFDASIEPLVLAFTGLSDQSGLTFDPDVAGIDLSDAVAYRLPGAVAQLEAARRRTCAARSAPSLATRIAVAKNQALADKSTVDAQLDVDDAIARQGSQLDVAALAEVLRRSHATGPAASRALDAYVTQPSPNLAQTQRAVDAAISNLFALSDAELPVLQQLIAQRLSDLSRQRLIRLVPGVVITLAVVLIGMLATRLLLEHTALEIAERTAAEQERMALHDSLTGIMNRRAFFATLQRAVTGGANSGALCVLDLDQFKAVNDTYGHVAGDEVLTRLAQIVEAAVRSTDAVARIGGDEFAVFLHPPIDRRGIERILERIAADMALPFELRGKTIRCTVSAGAATIHGDTMAGVNEAMARADAALYSVKERARGGFAVSEA